MSTDTLVSDIYHMIDTKEIPEGVPVEQVINDFGENVKEILRKRAQHQCDRKLILEHGRETGTSDTVSGRDRSSDSLVGLRSDGGRKRLASNQWMRRSLLACRRPQKNLNHSLKNSLRDYRWEIKRRGTFLKSSPAAQRGLTKGLACRLSQPN